jgi:ABC-type transporter Mla subunit MlaD
MKQGKAFMNQDCLQTEEALRESYEQQAATYAHALHLAEGLLANWKPGNDVTATLQKIAGLMADVAERNAAIQSLRQHLLENSAKPGPQLDAVLQSTASLIARLADRICQLERLATTCKNQLAPEMDGMLRGRQMQRAYATVAAGRTGRPGG